MEATLPDTPKRRRVTNLPSRERMAVDTLDGALDLYEADHRIFLDVIQPDIDTAICDDPKHCIAANAATLPDAHAAS